MVSHGRTKRLSVVQGEIVKFFSVYRYCWSSNFCVPNTLNTKCVQILALKNRNLNAYIDYKSVSKPVEVCIWPLFLRL